MTNIKAPEYSRSKYHRGKSWINAVQFIHNYPYPLFALKKDLPQAFKLLNIHKMNYNDFVNFLQKNEHSSIGFLQSHLGNYYAFKKQDAQGVLIKQDIKSILAHHILFYEPFFSELNEGFKNSKLHCELIRVASLINPHAVFFDTDPEAVKGFMRSASISGSRDNLINFFAELFAGIFNSVDEIVRPFMDDKLLSKAGTNRVFLYENDLRRNLSNHQQGFKNVHLILETKPLEELTPKQFMEKIRRSIASKKYQAINQDVTDKIPSKRYREFFAEYLKSSDKAVASKVEVKDIDFKRKGRNPSAFIDFKELKDFSREYLNQIKKNNIWSGAKNILISHFLFEKYFKGYLREIRWVESPIDEDISSSNLARLRHKFMNYEDLLKRDRNLPNVLVRYAALRAAISVFLMNDSFFLESENQNLYISLLNEIQMHKTIAFSNSVIKTGSKNEEEIVSKLIENKDYRNLPVFV